MIYSNLLYSGPAQMRTKLRCYVNRYLFLDSEGKLTVLKMDCKQDLGLYLDQNFKANLIDDNKFEIERGQFNRVFKTNNAKEWYKIIEEFILKLF